MKKRVEILLAVLTTAMMCMAGIGILSGKAHSQNDAEEVATEETAEGMAQGDMAEVLDLLDVISQDTEAILEIQDQLDEMSKKIDEMDKRLAKMEMIGLKTWDFVYKIRMPGGYAPDETKGMQDKMGSKTKLGSDARGPKKSTDDQVEEEEPTEETQPEEEQPEEER